MECVNSFSPTPCPNTSISHELQQLPSLFIHDHYLDSFFKEMALKCQKRSQKWLRMTLPADTRSEEEAEQKALTAAADISVILQVLQDRIRAPLFCLINIWLRGLHGCM